MRPPRRSSAEPWRLSAAVAALLLTAYRPIRAEEFFATRNQNPLLRGFYLPLPSDGRQDAGTALSATLLVSNTLNVENRPGEDLLVDGESDTLNLTYGNGLGQNWRHRFTLPIIHDSGGILDSAVDTWHEALGFSRSNRPYYPKGHIDYSYSGAGNINVNHPQTSIGDVAADAGWYAVEDARHTLSVWGGIKAPTGSVADLTSDGAWDAALWAHAAVRGTEWQGAAELGIAQPFGDEIFAGMAHRSSMFARFAATRVLGPTWSLRAQLDGQSGRVIDSELRFLGPSLQLTLGAARGLRGRWRIEMGLAEDVAVNTAPDITFFLGIHD